MKQESIKEKHAKRKKEAVYGVLGFSLLQLICGASFGCLCLIPELPGWLFVCFLMLAIFCILLILPAWGMLRMRFKEIEGGEWDAAGQY